MLAITYKYTYTHAHYNPACLTIPAGTGFPKNNSRRQRSAVNDLPIITAPPPAKELHAPLPPPPPPSPTTSPLFLPRSHLPPTKFSSPRWASSRTRRRRKTSASGGQCSRAFTSREQATSARSVFPSSRSRNARHSRRRSRWAWHFFRGGGRGEGEDTVGVDRGWPMLCLEEEKN